ncbi:MAG TPA: hypothetical protein VGB87_09405 [Vicinamibacteria bacterium]
MARRPGIVPVALALLLGPGLPPAPSAQEPLPAPVAPRPPGAGIAIGDVTWADGEVERAELPAKSAWRRMGAGDKVRTGDTFRAGASSTARLEFPWMAVTLAPGAMLTIPASTVLSTVLEQGRAEFAGPGKDIVKILVGDVEVRGGGRLVLRRSPGRTSASALDGSFRVRAARRTVEIAAGQGTVVADGAPPASPSPLPAAPKGLVPGKDPVYVRSGQAIELRWAGSDRAHHVEVLGLAGDEVLLSREAGAPPFRVEIPWLGTYRWRVSARDARGVESRPSADGLICSVER